MTPSAQRPGSRSSRRRRPLTPTWKSPPRGPGQAGLKLKGWRPSCHDLDSLTGRLPVWTCLFVAIVGNGIAAAPARGDSGWTVRSFDVTLEVRPDAELEVTELIDADFQVPKHGIYREIPIRYAVGMQQYALRFRLLGVDDGAGKSYGTAVSYEENRVRIRIGSAAETLSGPVRYRIRYRVERAILWEGTRAWGGEEGNRDHAILRWNATGTEWGVPIRRSTVMVKLPGELDDSQVIYDAWTGVYGAKDKDFTKRRVDARTIAFDTDALRQRRGDHRRGDDARRRGLTAWLGERGRRVAGRQLPVRDLPRDIVRLHRRVVLPRPRPAGPGHNRRQLRASGWTLTGRGRHPDR